MTEYVTINGARLTPWMAYQISRLDADFFRIWGCHIVVLSAIRTYQEQVNIFLSRYVTAPNVNGRKVYDTRVWNGVRWYRISPLGTVAIPGTSNHEIQGTKAAVDLGDTGSGAGVAVAGSSRANWLRANAWHYDMVPSGYSFKEAWHLDILNVFSKPPGTPSGGENPVPIPDEPEEEEELVYTVHFRTVDAAGKGAVTEATLGHFEFGNDLDQFVRTAEGGVGGKRTDSNGVVTFLGFKVTSNPKIYTAWARIYAKGTGQVTSRTGREDYIDIQAELSRVAAELRS